MIESLEARRFLSSDPVFWVSSTQEISIQTDLHLTHAGTLAIKGTDGADSLSVTRNGKYINYKTKNGDTIANFFVEASKVKRILVEAGSGDDRVFVDPKVDRPCTIVGGSGNDRIDGNYGATMIGGNGNDRLFAATPMTIDATGDVTVIGVSRIAGPALLLGGAGNDTLVGNEGDDFAGGIGTDNGVLYLPNNNPTTVSGDSINGKKLADFFTDSTGLEVMSMQVGTGKGAVFSGIYNRNDSLG